MTANYVETEELCKRERKNVPAYILAAFTANLIQNLSGLLNPPPSEWLSPRAAGTLWPMPKSNTAFTQKKKMNDQGHVI